MELTEREMRTLGFLLESPNHRDTVGHHPKAVKADLMRDGLIVEDGWKTNHGPYYKLTDLGVERARAYEARRQEA